MKVEAKGVCLHDDKWPRVELEREIDADQLYYAKTIMFQQVKDKINCDWFRVEFMVDGDPHEPWQSDKRL